MPPRRLRSSSDIRAVFAARSAAAGPAMVVHRREAGADPAGVAVVAGRKVGNAVVRNRAKRRLRAALQEVAVPDGAHVVVVARRPAVDLRFRELVAQLDGLIDRAAGRRP